MDKHLRELTEGSGIDLDIVEMRGYRSLQRPVGETPNGFFDSDELKRLGFNKAARDIKDPSLWPMLWIPSYNSAGKFVGSGQIKPHLPRKTEAGKDRKYESPTGKPAIVDVHPYHRDRVADPTVELWIVEGIKKADSLTSRLRESAVVVGITGVWNWRSAILKSGAWETIPLRGRKVTVCFDADVRVNPMVALAMRRLGNWLREKGAEVQYVAPSFENEDGAGTKGVDDFFVAGGTLEELKANRQARPYTVDTDDSFSDRSLAQCVASEEFEGQLHFTANGWFGWNGIRWAPLNDENVMERLGVWMDEKLRKAISDARKGKSDQVKDWIAVRSAGKALSILRWLKGLLEADLGEFDTNPDLLNCPNGVVDLRTGELMEHDPALLMTKCALVEYDPEAKCDDWDKALRALPEDVVPWFQVRMGQAATGYMDPTARLLILQSGGNSGKSTIMFAMKNVLGDYAIQMDDSVLLQRNSDRASSASPEMMALRGARFAYMDETPESAQLNDVRLKKIQGTPEITARDLFKSNVTFRNSITNMLSTNFPPKVARTDRGTWRRLALLKFPYTYVMPGFEKGLPEERPEDPGLLARVESDPAVHKAVLAWIIEGARMWYANPLLLNDLPASVLDDTEKWRTEVDHVTRFIQEHLEFDPNSWVPGQELYRLFVEVVETEGARPLGKIEFGRRFTSNDLCRAAGVEAVSSRPSAMVGSVDGYGGRMHIPEGNPVIRAMVGIRMRHVSDVPL